MYDLDGKVAIVTGAARMRGIGRGCALALAKSGADVVITGTNRSPDTFPEEEKAAGWQGLASVASEIEALGRKALILTSDAAKLEDVQAMVQATLERFGHVDILVNNAAASRGNDRQRVVNLPEELFEKVVMTNLMSTFLCSKYVAREMIKQGQGGKIVNISSVAGKRGNIGTAAYSSSKFGIIGLTQSLAMELAKQKINVNAVCPGWVETSRMAEWGVKQASDWGVSVAEAKARLAQQTVPLGRATTGDEIGDVVAFLCSKYADYMTGQAINVCGGMVFH